MKGQTKVLPELNWKQKLTGKGTIKSDDVSITLSNVTKGKDPDSKRIHITIRNKLWTQLDSRYVIFAVMKNRIYFKGTDNKNEGYALCIKDSEFSAYISAKLTPAEVPLYSQFRGDFSWKYDEYYELYYIERDDADEQEE